MNTCHSLVFEEAKQKFMELINYSDIAPEDFLRELANLYGIKMEKNSFTQLNQDYETYCDSFVE